MTTDDVRRDRSIAVPLIDRPAPERSDAARNRRRILAVAQELVATDGVGRLSMNDVAAAARVGVGTVYRRFGDLAGLIASLMDERERRLQYAFMAGPRPLGPGAPPVERIRAFLHAYADVLDTYAAMMSVAESTTPTGRFRNGVYAVHHAHLAALISEARPDADAHYLADALLAPLAAGLFVHHRHEQGMTPGRIKAGLDDLLAGLLVTPGLGSRADFSG